MKSLIALLRAASSTRSIHPLLAGPWISGSAADEQFHGVRRLKICKQILKIPCSYQRCSMH